MKPVTDLDVNRVLNNLPVFQNAIENYDINSVYPENYEQEYYCLSFLTRILLKALETTQNTDEVIKLIPKVDALKIHLGVRLHFARGCM